MKLIKEEESSKSYLIEHFDDLWILSKYLNSSDTIYSKTQRKVALGSDKKKQVIKIMFVELEVKKVELSSHSLNILGIIQNENEFTKIGAHHSLHYEIGETIEIKDSTSKKGSYLTNLFNQSLHSTKNKYIIILCDVDSMIVSKCSNFSLDILYEGSRLGPKKYFSTSKQISGVEQMFEILQELSLNDFEIFIFAGPGKYKLQLSDLFKKAFQNKEITTVDMPDCEISTISLVMQHVDSLNIISGVNQGKMDQKVDSFLKLMNQNLQKVAYSKEAVFEKIMAGACEEVIISTHLFDILQDEQNEYIKTIEQMHITINLIESSSHKGKIVDGMGGIIAFLRF